MDGIRARKEGGRGWNKGKKRGREGGDGIRARKEGGSEGVREGME